MPAVNDIDMRARKRVSAARRLAAPADAARKAVRRKPVPVPPLLRHAALGLALVALAGAAGFGGYFAWRHGGPAIGKLRAAAEGWPALSGMTVQDVTVEGRRLVSREAVLAAVGVRRGDPMLMFDPRAARERLESIEWVEQAVVERRLPDTIFVRLKERAAVALWQHDKQFVLIDRQGRQVRTVDPSYYGYLPLIAGAGAPEQITALFLLLSEVPQIGKRVRAAVWVGQRRWNLTLDNTVEVKLPEQDAAAALKRLAELDRTDQLLSRDVASIDLRLPDRLVVRPNRPAGAPAGSEDKTNAGAGKAKPAGKPT